MKHKFLDRKDCLNVHFGTVLVLLFAVILPGRAAEETSKHRVIGLSEPSRQDDLREIIKTMPDVQLVSLDFETTEATFKYDVTKLIPNFNPKKPPTAETITKRIDELLRSASRGSFSLKPLATIEKEKMKVEEIPVGMLDCKGCRFGVYLAVAKVEGVERATVSSDTGTLRAWIDPAKTNRAALEDVLKKAHIESPGHDKLPVK